jgi:3,4-dihydroxy 2-butanone 4-phosphate synthase / GTP cyclohydrolase II
MFNKIEELVEEIRNGRMVIVLDDESRENEGDLVFAAKFTNPEKINFLLKNARGLICIPMDENRTEMLGLANMVENNTESNRTAFTVSVDAYRDTTTGISASDRAITALRLADMNVKKSDFVTPGHMFPLKAKFGGVLERPGHTEAAVDLVKLAGCDPAVGVICEIIREDGEMARKDDLLKFALEHDLKIGSIKDLIAYKRFKYDKLILEAETEIPISELGEWKIKVFRNIENQKENIALIKGDLSCSEPLLTRIHSECFTGDVFGSEKCDCRYQLRRSMELINKTGKGIIIYLRQEGRGIGLINKIKAYQLQNEGLDTLDANIKLGFQPDIREYSEAAEILKKLNVGSVKLITNNQDKVNGLQENSIEVKEQVVLPSIINSKNERYLRTKKVRCGHKIVEFELCV